MLSNLANPSHECNASPIIKWTKSNGFSQIKHMDVIDINIYIYNYVEYLLNKKRWPVGEKLFFNFNRKWCFLSWLKSLWVFFLFLAKSTILACRHFYLLEEKKEKLLFSGRTGWLRAAKNFPLFQTTHKVSGKGKMCNHEQCFNFLIYKMKLWKYCIAQHKITKTAIYPKR